LIARRIRLKKLMAVFIIQCKPLFGRKDRLEVA